MREPVLDEDAHAGEGADLVVRRPRGLYCPAGDFYIDPWRPVDRAVITHAHADHARAGHAHYLASAEGAQLLHARLGDIRLQPLAWGETVTHRGVRLSLHPAGHVLGSAQVRIEHGGRVWVVSGDYFVSGARDHNTTCSAFEPQRCDCFITESTFALPVYRWRAQSEIFDQINAWWRGNAEAGRASVLLAYSLGKAQRILAGVDASIGPILVHGAVEPINAAYRAAGVALPATRPLPADAAAARDAGRGALVVAPPAARGGAWARHLGDAAEAFASGWMQLRGARRRQSLDRGFVLSDHADWPGLLSAIAATGAPRVIAMHGHDAVLQRWLGEQGLCAEVFETAPGDAPQRTPAAAQAGA